MAQTYNLGASDLLTLLGSTVGPNTEVAILDSIVGAFGASSVFASTTSVQTEAGPSNTSTSGIAPLTDTIASGTQLTIVTVPGSHTNPAIPITPVNVGAQTTPSKIQLRSSGGGIIAAGDQVVKVFDRNTGAKADTVIGGAGSEVLLSTGTTANLLVAGTGANALFAGSAADTLIGGSGDDTLVGGLVSRLQAGTGANTLYSSTLAGGADVMIGGAGADLLVAQGGNNKLYAGSGANTLVGGPGDDTLWGMGGTYIELGAGKTHVLENSTLSGEDTIIGGTATDTINLRSSTVDDSIVGSSGKLNIFDLAGQNTIVGGSGADYVQLYAASPTATLKNTSNQTITAGSGGVTIGTNESYSSYSVTNTGSVYTVKFSDTGQTLKITDATGTSVTLTFSGHGNVTL